MKSPARVGVLFMVVAIFAVVFSSAANAFLRTSEVITKDWCQKIIDDFSTCSDVKCDNPIVKDLQICLHNFVLEKQKELEEQKKLEQQKKLERQKKSVLDAAKKRLGDNNKLYNKAMIEYEAQNKLQELEVKEVPNKSYLDTVDSYQNTREAYDNLNTEQNIIKLTFLRKKQWDVLGEANANLDNAKKNLDSAEELLKRPLVFWSEEEFNGYIKAANDFITEAKYCIDGGKKEISIIDERSKTESLSNDVTSVNSNDHEAERKISGEVCKYYENAREEFYNFINTDANKRLDNIVEYAIKLYFRLAYNNLSSANALFAQKWDEVKFNKYIDNTYFFINRAKRLIPYLK